MELESTVLSEINPSQKHVSHVFRHAWRLGRGQNWGMRLEGMGKYGCGVRRGRVEKEERTRRAGVFPQS